jgi:hypothetical protein
MRPAASGDEHVPHSRATARFEQTEQMCADSHQMSLSDAGYEWGRFVAITAPG